MSRRSAEAPQARLSWQIAVPEQRTKGDWGFRCRTFWTVTNKKKKRHVKSERHRTGESKPVLKALLNKTLIIDLILSFFQCPSIEKKKNNHEGKTNSKFWSIWCLLNQIPCNCLWIQVGFLFFYHLSAAWRRSNRSRRGGKTFLSHYNVGKTFCWLEEFEVRLAAHSLARGKENTENTKSPC